ncbi:hypothetical protein SKAU_G00240500 [Synaphobranchus kaupii]|uniref:Rubicon Homology domain-containing protein n=1 Tax=Synaphobranchus kaupii TaxID=118154 RepID=A0A9Q1F7X4_SYNKA|nr:hypothetical protein SKAU_G00240500 [Synaphobranchus kaupii]
MDPEGVLKVNGSGSVLPHGPLPHSRPHCVSWSAGSAPHRAVPLPLLAPGPTLAEEFSNPAVIGHLGGSQHLSASPVSVRKMLLSLLESSGEARYQPLSQRSPPVRRGTPTSREGPRSDSDSSEDNPAARHSADSDDGGYNEPGQGGAPKRRNGPQLDPKAGPGCVLPRRTSVISRRKCLSRPKREAWSLVLQTPTHQAAAPSPNRLRAHSTRASKSPPLDLQPHPPHSPEKPRCVSFSANLNRLLGVGLHLPFRCQEEGHKPRTQSDAQISPGPRKCMDRSENPHTPDSILRASCDLEKENAHFVVADMVLEAVEGAKWAVLSQRGAEVSRWCADCIQENETKNCTPQPIKHSASVGSSDSGYVEWCSPQSTSASSRSPSLTQEQPPPTDADKPETATDSDSSSLPSSSQFPTILCSAEVLALQLVSEFKKQWFAKEDLGTTSLGSALQEFFPDNDSMATEDILALADEIKQKSRMRGTLTWAPPRFQIIFSTHPTQKRSVVVASQHYLCAGCGTQVEDKYLKKLRYCEYLGRYFCDCCHSDGESVIPGHVLEKWDFGRYPVCTFSHQLLDSVWHQPLFSLAWVANNLGSRARELPRFMEVQEQLLAIKKLLTVCRLSDRVLAELEQLPGHLTQEPVLLSMDDLQRIKRGQLVSQARVLLRTAVAHVDSCQVCLARGFICEFCKRKDVLFPFQTESCRRCRDCKACFHIECFRDEKCPKCLRIQTRRTLTD